MFCFNGVYVHWGKGCSSRAGLDAVYIVQQAMFYSLAFALGVVNRRYSSVFVSCA